MKIGLDKKIQIFYLILSIIACISLVFTNISYDAEYQMAMAYRMIKGDSMILEMWEPHQTSAFLCAFFMKIYMMLTGTTTGIVLYIQVIGLLIKLGISFGMYKLIRKYAGEIPGLISMGIYLLSSPKDLLLPEFSNMQLWFGTLLFLFMMQYIQKAKLRYLILAAIFFCGGVFSYPSFLIVGIAVIIILAQNSKHVMRDIVLFACVGLAIGGTFAAYLLLTVGGENIVNCISAALAVEPSHTVGPLDKITGHAKNVALIGGMFAGVGVIGLLPEGVACLLDKARHKAKCKPVLKRWLLFSWFVLLFFFLLNILSVSNRGGYAFPFMVMIAVGLRNRKILNVEEKKLYDCAFWISVFSLLATLILSDHVFLQGVTYMFVLICVSVVPIWRWFQTIHKDAKMKALFVAGVHLFLLLVVFRCVYLHVPFYGRGQIYSLASDIAFVKSGPALGILGDEEGVARQRDSMAEWELYINEKDTIWIVGEPVDTLGYLYKDVEVGAPTVMSTPTYTEDLLYYWELNPEKYPDVIIVASSYGNISDEIISNRWFMDWLEQEYCAEYMIEGNYWNYYFAEERHDK